MRIVVVMVCDGLLYEDFYLRSSIVLYYTLRNKIYQTITERFSPFY